MKYTQRYLIDIPMIIAGAWKKAGKDETVKAWILSDLKKEMMQTFADDTPAFKPAIFEKHIDKLFN